MSQAVSWKNKFDKASADRNKAEHFVGLFRGALCRLELALAKDNVDREAVLAEINRVLTAFEKDK